MSADEYMDLEWEPEDDSETYDEYNSMSDEELRKEIKLVLESMDYVENNFTEMVKSIIQFNSFTPKQRHVLIMHLIYSD